MKWRRVAALTVLSGALSSACADEPTPAPLTPAAVNPAAAESAPPAAKPLPRSSIAAVVRHRGELNLSEEQIEAMEKRDQEREQEDQALRAEEEKRKKAAEDAGNNAANGAPGRAPGGMRGGGMRGGGMGPRTGGSFGGGAGKPKGESMADRLDANDTKAYLDIEDILTPEQRDAAREIASDYRAQLYDRREQQAKADKK